MTEPRLVRLENRPQGFHIKRVVLGDVIFRGLWNMGHLQSLPDDSIELGIRSGVKAKEAEERHRRNAPFVDGMAEAVVAREAMVKVDLAKSVDRVNSVSATRRLVRMV